MGSTLLMTTIVLLAGLLGAAGGEPPPPAVGRPAPDFSLTDVDGREHTLRDYRGKHVVMAFISARCPISRAYLERIRAITLDLGQRPDTVMLGVNSSADESVTEIRADKESNRLTFPILHDPDGQVADLFGAERTPAIYVIDSQGLLRYRGRIDSAHRPRPDMRHDLREALTQLFTGHPIATPETVVAGCPIVRIPTPNAVSGQSPSVTPPFQVRLLAPKDFRRMIAATPGKVVVVNFWATWCGPCVAELPELIRISESMKNRGVRFVGISADDQADLNSTVIPFIVARRIPYEQFLQQTDDPQEMIDVVDKNWPGTLPATFVYDRRGRLVFHRLGIIDRETLEAEIEKALKSQPVSTKPNSLKPEI